MPICSTVGGVLTAALSVISRHEDAKLQERDCIGKARQSKFASYIMRDKFLAQIQRSNQHPLLLRQIASTFRRDVALSSYPALQGKILRFAKHANAILLHKRPPSWGAFRPTLLLARVSLEKEFYWQVNQLQRFVQPINDHLNKLAEITEAINQSNWPDATSRLKEHLLQHGASLWNLEAQIACALRDEAGDKAVDHLIDELPGGLTGFSADLFADLYDHESTLGGFRGRVEQIAVSSSRALSDYFAVKFFRANHNPEQLALFLNIESAFSYVDCYNAILAVMEAVAESDDAAGLMPLLLQQLAPLRGIRDERFMRFLEMAEVGRSEKSEIPSDLIISSRHFPRLRAISNCFAKGTSSWPDERPPSTLETYFEEQLGPLGNANVDLYEVYRSLQTAISKHHFLPWAKAMATAIDGIFFPLGLDKNYLTLCGACVPATPSLAPTWINAEHATISERLIARGIEVHPWVQIYGAIDADPTRFLRALKASNAKNVDDALLILEGASWLPICSFGADALRVSALIERNDEKGALSLCVKESLARESRAGFLPFHTLVGDAETFSDLEHYDLVDLTIGLHFCLQSSRESKTQFHLEFACKILLQKYKCTSLVELADHFLQDDERIHFILWKVFTSSNLRLVRFLRSADEFDQARLEICRLLLDIKKDDVQEILGEIRSVLRRHELRHAESEIESTRIAVNKDGIRRWAEENHREQFNRIKKGRVSRIAPTVDEVHESLRQVLEATVVPGRDATLETNYQDPLFAIGSAIFSQCFTKQDDGLDHFLSLRIRHGSFVGYLRAPLERARLVEQGNLDPDSKVAHEWGERLSRSLPYSVSAVIAALGRFQTNFDSMVEEFRSDFLQLRSDTKPRGLFLIGHPKVVWDAFHADWEELSSFDAFFESVWTAFRSRLEFSLEEVKKHIDEVMLLKAEGMIRELRKEAERAGLDPIDRASVISSINDGTRWLQESVAVVKGWFAFSEEPLESTSLDFEQVLDVALNIFKNARPSLKIQFSRKEIPTSVQFVRMLVPRLTDVFFIMLDNVYRHSGLSGVAEVELLADWRSESDTLGCLSLTMTNKLGPSVGIAETRLRLNKIQEQIETGQMTAALTGEGRSGLIKLAKLAKGRSNQATETLVSFSCSDSRTFTVTANLYLEYQPRSS